ncbi:MAG TPA: hypothetical protein VFT59_01570 [Candidatus Saccharimonadales bacterium]|nr:hypothetical protein [Candidatus Saccharimonadales bacterium]
MRSIRQSAHLLLQPRLRLLLWTLLAFTAWWTWMGLVMGALALVNSGIFSPEIFESLKVALTVIMLVGITVLYLCLVGRSSWREGLVAGMVVMVVTIIMDSWFYMRMTADIGAGQLINATPSYLAIPVVTTLILGLLKKR